MSSGPSLLRRVRWGAELALHFSGVTSLYAHARPGGAVVLMYHSVAPPDVARFIDSRVRISPRLFTRQMTLLSRHRHVLSMTELTERSRRSDLPHDSVVVTFDDGYLDTLTVAAPILAHFQLPAIVYLPTEYISRGEPQWVDRLYTALRYRRHDRVVLRDGARLDLRGDMERFRSLLEPMLMVATMDERNELLTALEAQLAPRLTAPRLTMTWDDVRALQRGFPFLEFGIHTAEHLDLTALPRELAQADLLRAQETAMTELGRPLRHFSFPYSRDNAETRELVRRLGYVSAVGSGDHYRVDEHSDPHALSRIEPGGRMAMFRFWTSGAYPGLSRALWGRA